MYDKLLKMIDFWPHILNLFKNVVQNLKSHPILSWKSFLKTSAYLRVYTVGIKIKEL